MLAFYNFTTSEFLLVLAFFVAISAKIVIDILVPIEQAEAQREYELKLHEKLKQMEEEERQREREG